jgi:hypothetical protein
MQWLTSPFEFSFPNSNGAAADAATWFLGPELKRRCKGRLAPPFELGALNSSDAVI